MAIGLYLRGRSETEDWIERLRQRLADLHHPAAEPVDVSDDGIVSAATTPVGPGYHVALCEALDEATRELGISWDAPDDDTGDDTGYFHERDLRAVERHMLGWLRTLVRVSERESVDELRLCMPMDHGYQLGGAHTPTGPRDLAWFRDVAGDPTRGLDFFPWWTPGENAAALLGRARCLMWTETRWREPNHEAERDVDEEVVALLERAWALDPTLDYPAREWCELAEDPPDEIKERAQTTIGPLIGYRRHPVRVFLGSGWSIEIPGELSEEWEEGTWSAWHEGRTIWFSAYGRAAPAAELVEAAPADGEVIHRHDGAVVKKGYLQASDDGFMLSTRNAIDGKLGVATIVYPDEAARDWAMRAWESLRCG